MVKIGPNPNCQGLSTTILRITSTSFVAVTRMGDLVTLALSLRWVTGFYRDDSPIWGPSTTDSMETSLRSANNILELVRMAQIGAVGYQPQLPSRGPTILHGKPDRSLESRYSQLQVNGKKIVVDGKPVFRRQRSKRGGKRIRAVEEGVAALYELAIMSPSLDLQ